jgi:DNA-binding transcriptional LysR family regulator
MILFATVVHEGGFTSAARRLGLTKQSVSERIAKLEQQLGVRLLERSTRWVRLTDRGALYHAHCVAIASRVDEANAEVQRLQAEPTGLLRVSAPALYGRRYLAPLLAELLAEHPKLRVDLSLTDRRVDLIEEGFDVAIRVGELDDSALTARKLGEGHVYYLASPSYLGRARSVDLRRARCIGIRAFETWRHEGAAIKIEPVLVVNDLEVACAAAVAGVGVARLPSIVCREAVEAGQLRVLFGPEPIATPSVYAIYPSRAHLPPKVRVFVDALARMAAPMGPLRLGRAKARAS